MFAYMMNNNPPVRAIIWDLDGMVIRINAKDGEMAMADLEALVRFILALCQDYNTTILGRQSAMNAVPFARFEELFLPMKEWRHDDYLSVVHRLEALPERAVVIAIDPLRLSEANRLGFLTIVFQNPRQAVSELLPMLAEPLAV